MSGRTVGIGAYLARLGRRCVQRADQPIILTGYAALNKLLGREVYTSHMQLGGPKVSHEHFRKPGSMLSFRQAARSWRLGTGDRMKTFEVLSLAGYRSPHWQFCRQAYAQAFVEAACRKRASWSSSSKAATQVMGQNGVSHQVVADDLEGIKAVLAWLAYAPAQIGAAPPPLPTSDPVSRTISYIAPDGALGLPEAPTSRMASTTHPGHSIQQLIFLSTQGSRSRHRGGDPVTGCGQLYALCDGIACWCKSVHTMQCHQRSHHLLGKGSLSGFSDAQSAHAGGKMDPRCAIAGREAGFSDSSGASLGADAGWESGLFDRGSWIEAQVRVCAHERWTIWLERFARVGRYHNVDKSTAYSPASQHFRGCQNPAGRGGHTDVNVCAALEI